MASVWWKRKLEPWRLKVLWGRAVSEVEKAATRADLKIQGGQMTREQMIEQQERFGEFVAGIDPDLRLLLAASLLLGAAACGTDKSMPCARPSLRAKARCYDCAVVSAAGA